ncbi:SIMPL domain-containing protein [bacterium]|nr:SIMPL domain-containing protein [bacterium]
MLEKVLNYLEKFQLIFLGIVLMLGLIIATNIVTSALPNDGITVTGSASRIVKSDKGSLTFDITTRQKSRKLAYAEIQKQIPIVVNFLKTKGLTDKDIEIKTPNGYNTYKTLPNGNSSNEFDYYNLYQPITVKSSNVDNIKELSIALGSLTNRGIEINQQEPEYYYSKISNLKVELLHEATTDAKQRAKAMLKATHNRTGKIQSVKMGVFQITASDSTDVSDGGIYNTSSIEKKVTAVANVVFKIK